MALNKYMHPRNIYKTKKPDFKQLALKYGYFRERVTQNLNGKVILDFKDPASLRALTQALLEDDFGLNVTLPVDRLIPTVPQRLNYILWLEDIIGANIPARGVDIGTGASCIYPLLGCKQNGWEFLASEVDDQNLLFATENVKKNKMEEKIKIKKVEEDKLLFGVVEDSEKYDFCMCNPPFFSDHLEAQGITATRSDDRPDPKSLSTASEKESIAWGGEVRFVCQMIEESLVLKDRIRVYTSMLGKKMSLSLIKDQLTKKKIIRFASTEFCQGRTMRWGIAWTFDENLNFPKSAFKTLKKPVVPLTFEVPRNIKTVTEYTVQAFTEFVRAEIEGLKINYHVKHSGKFYTYLILQAKENTWSHQRRKRRKEKFAALCASQATVQGKGNVSSTENNAHQSNSNENQSEMLKDLNGSGSSKMTADTDNVKEMISKENNAEQSKNNEYHSDLLKDLNGSGSSKITVDIDNVKEMKNLKNLIERDEMKVKDEIVNNNIDSDINLKRKREDLPEERNSKKFKTERCNTQDMPVDSETEKESSTCDRDSNKCTQARIDAVSLNVNNNSSKPLLSVCTGRDSEMKGEHLCIDKDKSNMVSSVEINQNQQNVYNKPSLDEINTFSSVSEPNNEGVTNSNVTDDKKDTETFCNGAEKDQSYMKEKDSNRMPSRAEIVTQFWEEKEANKKKPGGKKRVPQSIYERMESFDQAEDCLVLLKLMIRKDEGIVTFNFTYMSGMKEAVHQIMQYFRNKLL